MQSRFLFPLLMGMAAAFGGAPAGAFQEVPVPERPSAAPTPPGVALDFGLARNGAAPKPKRPEGILPKLDFGLDLLYSGETAPVQPPAFIAPEKDMSVMGTIKRKF